MSYTINTRPTKKGLAFDLHYRWKGVRSRPLLGYNLTKEQAERAAIAMIAKVQANTDKTKSVERTLSNLLPLFWDSFEVKGRTDRIRPKGIIDNHLLPAFGGRPLAALTSKNGLDYVVKRRNEKASAGTIRREWQVLMRLLNLAVGMTGSTKIGSRPWNCRTQTVGPGLPPLRNWKVFGSCVIA